MTMEGLGKKDHDLDIGRLATLARIHLTESEVADLHRRLDTILEHLDRISAVDVSGVEPSAHAFPLYNVFREDRAGETFPVETALENAPQRRDGLFIVPKVVE
jgi:aspartyl-tRNA(Asn)/glutamyl-tRNA(Gln) amidotransferase subunit C